MIRLLLCAVWIGVFTALLFALRRPDAAPDVEDGKQTYIAGLHYKAPSNATWWTGCKGGRLDGTYSAWVVFFENGRSIAKPKRHELLIEWHWDEGKLDTVTVDQLPNQLHGNQTSKGGKRFPDWTARLLRSWSTVTWPRYRDRRSEEAILLSLCDMVDAKQNGSFINTVLFTIDGLLSDPASPEGLRLLADFVNTGRGHAPAATTADELRVALQCSVDERLRTADKLLRDREQFHILEQIKDAIGRPSRPCTAGNATEPTWYATVVLTVAIVVQIVLQTLFRRARSLPQARTRYRPPGPQMPNSFPRLQGPERSGVGGAVAAIDADSNPLLLEGNAILSLPNPSSGDEGGALPAPMRPASIHPSSVDRASLFALLETFVDRQQEEHRFAELRECLDIAMFAEMLVTRFFDGLSKPLESKRLEQLDSLLAKASGDRLRLLLVKPRDAYDRKRHHCVESVRVYLGVIGRMKLLRPGLVYDGIVVHKARVALTI